MYYKVSEYNKKYILIRISDFLIQLPSSSPSSLTTHAQPVTGLEINLGRGVFLLFLLPPVSSSLVLLHDPHIVSDGPV
jgi:hypothetical protein